MKLRLNAGQQLALLALGRQSLGMGRATNVEIGMVCATCAQGLVTYGLAEVDLSGRRIVVTLTPKGRALYGETLS